MEEHILSAPVVVSPASGFCLVLGPEFPEVAHRVPALIGLEGGISLRELIAFFCLFMFTCLCHCLSEYLLVALCVYLSACLLVCVRICRPMSACLSLRTR